MARIRTIKPEFWEDEKIGKLKRDERLFFIGLWNISDDEGVIKANPLYLKNQLFPYDGDLRISTVSSWLGNLQKARMLIPFTLTGEGYYIIRTFQNHQVINRPSKSKWPDGLLQQVLDSHGAFTEGSHLERKGKEQGNGTGKGKEVHEDAVSVDFDLLKTEKKNNQKKINAAPRIFQNPFSESFLTDWDNWLQYRHEQHGFNYKSVTMEQAAVGSLVEISGGDEKKAIAIIRQSIAKGWKGFFEVKEHENGDPKKQRQQGNGSKVTGDGINDAFTKFHHKG